jgi:hypothetical protein
MKIWERIFDKLTSLGRTHRTLFSDIQTDGCSYLASRDATPSALSSSVC